MTVRRKYCLTDHKNCTSRLPILPPSGIIQFPHSTTFCGLVNSARAKSRADSMAKACHAVQM